LIDDIDGVEVEDFKNLISEKRKYARRIVYNPNVNCSTVLATVNNTIGTARRGVE
jgi:hypothetical protein